MDPSSKFCCQKAEESAMGWVISEPKPLSLITEFMSNEQSRQDWRRASSFRELPFCWDTDVAKILIRNDRYNS